MLREDILDRLRVDPGQRTIGQLMQEREQAAQEIRKLRADMERLRAMRRPRGEKGETEETGPISRPAMFLRLTEVCEMIGVGRSTIYKWVNEGTFPAPVKISERAIRWNIDEIEKWRDAL